MVQSLRSTRKTVSSRGRQVRIMPPAQCRCGGATKSTTFSFPLLYRWRVPWSRGIILLCFYESSMCARCHRLCVPMRVRCTIPRHAIDDATQWPPRPDHPSGNCQLGVSGGRSGCVRSLTRSSPDNTGDRSDPIRSHSGQWRTRVFPSRVVVDRKRPVSCDKCQFSLVSEARRHRNARTEISSSAFRVRIGHAIGTGRGERHLRPTSAFLLDDRHCVLRPGNNAKYRKMRARAAAWVVHIESAKAIVSFIKRLVINLPTPRRVSKRLPRLRCVTLLDVCTCWSYYILLNFTIITKGPEINRDMFL